MAKFAVYNSQGKLVGSDQAKSMTFIRKFTMTVSYNGSRIFSSGVLPSDTIGKVMAFRSTEPVGIGYDGGYRLYGNQYRPGSEANPTGPWAFNVEVYVFDRPTVTQTPGPGLRVYDETGAITFNSSDYKARIASVNTAGMSAGLAYSAFQYDLRPSYIIQSINTGLPAGPLYALHLSPTIWYYQWLYSQTANNTRFLRFFPICMLSGSTILVSAGEDFFTQAGGRYSAGGIFSDNITRNLTYTVFDVSQL